jgi:hypothetical protein
VKKPPVATSTSSSADPDESSLEQARPETRLYVIQNPSCRFYERSPSTKKWVRSQRVFNRGARYIGLEPARVPGKVLFKADKTLYVADATCLKPYHEGFFARVFGKFSVYGLLSFTSWRDDMSIKDSDGGSSPLRVLNTVICPGVGISMTHRWYNISLDSCFLFGKAQLTNSEAVPSISYSAVNAPIFGVANTVHLLWISESGFVNFGLALPLYIKSGVWPVPSDTLKIHPATGLSWGTLVEARFERGPFHFTQSVGFMGKLHNFLWNIQGAWVF